MAHRNVFAQKRETFFGTGNQGLTQPVTQELDVDENTKTETDSTEASGAESG